MIRIRTGSPRIGRAGFPFKRSFRSPSWLYAALRETGLGNLERLKPRSYATHVHYRYLVRVYCNDSAPICRERRSIVRNSAKIACNELCVRKSCVKYQRFSIDLTYFQILTNTFHNLPCNLIIFLIVFITRRTLLTYTSFTVLSKVDNDNDLTDNDSFGHARRVKSPPVYFGKASSCFRRGTLISTDNRVSFRNSELAEMI